MRTPLLGLGLSISLALSACGSSKPTTTTTTTTPAASKVLVNVDDSGVILGGHDPIGYSKDGKPVMGAAENTAEHGNAKYQFASADNKAAFEADTAKHAPQYGGYCAFAASQNRLSPSDPTAFQIYEGQLLVFTNADFKDQFNKDAAANKAAADKNWPGLVEKHGK